MKGVIGRCSICGGEVHGYVGPWYGVIPPPPGRCQSCGAAEARGPVIPMVPRNRPEVDDNKADWPSTYNNTKWTP